MMGRALLVVGVVGTAGLVAAAVAGYAIRDPRALQLHLVLALVSCLLVLFSHCWIMFYLIGTGKAIRETVRERHLEAGLYERTKEFKNRSYPALMLAMALAMATFIAGGAAFAQAVPAAAHHALFYATLAAQCWALVLETRVLASNERLMAEIESRLRSAAALEVG
jgi:hypothetical protein